MRIVWLLDPATFKACAVGGRRRPARHTPSVPNEYNCLADEQLEPAISRTSAWPRGCTYASSTMSRMRSAFGCLLLVLALGSTAVAEVQPRLVCADACSDDDGDQPRPCGDDCSTCACCVAFHLMQPTPMLGVVMLPRSSTRPYFVEPLPLVSREGAEVFHIPKSPLA